MAFLDLSAELQNILLVNHSYTIKWFLFLVFVSLSVFYIFFVWKNHEPTIYITTVFFRLYFYGLSVVYLLLSPMSVLLMSPAFDIWSFYTLPFILYNVGFSLFVVIILFDFAKLGFLGLAKLGGLDVGDEGVNSFVKSWINNKHFLKFKKSNKRVFRR